MHIKEKINKKTAVILYSSNEYAVGIAVTIMSLEDRNPDLADNYIIFCDNWDEKILDYVGKISNKVRLIPYGYDIFEKNHPDLVKNVSFKRAIDRYSHLHYIYDEYLNLLDEFDQIICMGADLVIIGDITCLKDIDSIVWRCGMAKIKYKNQLIDRPNGCLYVFNKSIPVNELKKLFFMHLLEDHADEVAFAKSACDLNIKVAKLPFEYNTTVSVLANKSINNLTIFHCAGRKKIWNYNLYQYIFPEYIPYIKDFVNNVKNFNMIDNGVGYKNRYQFIKSVFFINNFNMTSLSIKNIYINTKFDLVKNEFFYYYKNYRNFYFMIRNIDIDKFRIYFVINNDNKLCFVNYINSHLDLKEKCIEYNYHEYSSSKCTFYMDCSPEDVDIRLNKMIDSFVYLLDRYDNYNIMDKN